MNLHLLVISLIHRTTTEKKPALPSDQRKLDGLTRDYDNYVKICSYTRKENSRHKHPSVQK